MKNGICSVDFDRKDIQMNKLVVSLLLSPAATLFPRNPECGIHSLESAPCRSTVLAERGMLLFSTERRGFSFDVLLLRL